MDALRVLIVDDEAELVSALEERLRLRGFHAHGVTTGAWQISKRSMGWNLLSIKIIFW